MKRLALAVALAFAPLPAVAGVTFSVSFSSAGPSAAFTPEERKPTRIYLSAPIPSGGVTLKCSLPGANNYLPFIVENLQMYVMTTAGIWEFQTAASGESCRLEYSGTAAGGAEIRQ
ncbi:hypothetical protein [Methylocystis parvus]|uniref:hypothetical protein n=1 Tax=Methylocystis parvus TaxID=134 RepID=UPI003C72E1D1